MVDLQIRKLFGMDSLDTGKVRVSVQGDSYILVAVYEEDEVTSDDVSLVLKYLDQFNRPVPVLLLRQCNYSLSFEVQRALMMEAHVRFKAFAYLERSHEDQLLTHLAKTTYMRKVPVGSFFDIKKAENWLAQFGGLPKVNP